jgi:hypothetical protein
MTLTARWHGTGRTAQCAPDPRYPNGKDMDMAQARKGCEIELDCPAPEIGHWFITCNVCGFTGVVTAAGRPDDPRNLRVACKTA